MTTLTEKLPRVYVGTYHKYASGSLRGQWVDLASFESFEHFDAFARLELHDDEDDPELMFQDWENIDERFICETGIDPLVWVWLELDEEERAAFNYIVDQIGIDRKTFDGAGFDVSALREVIEQYYCGIWSGDWLGFAWDQAEMNFGDSLGDDIGRYFDIEAYARDLAFVYQMDEATGIVIRTDI